MSVISESPRYWEGEFGFDDDDFPRLEERIAALKTEAQDILDEVNSYRVDLREDLIGYFRRSMGGQVTEVARRTSDEIMQVAHLYEQLRDTLRGGDTIHIQPLERTERQQQLQSTATFARTLNPENYSDEGEIVKKDPYLGDFDVFSAVNLVRKVPGHILKDFLDASTSVHGRGGVIGLGQMESRLRDGLPVRLIPQPAEPKR